MSSKSCLTAHQRAGSRIHHPEIAHGEKHAAEVDQSARERQVCRPGAPSDWRSLENTRHDLRRILARDGMLETASPGHLHGNQTGSSCWNGAWPRSSDGS
jgi:hypothetical protein